jgi:transcription termination factor NusB
MGAGILPTTIHNNKLYFLFGKENKYADTPGWCDFGGGTEKGESFMKTTLREGIEETTGFLGSEQDLSKMLKKHGTYNIEFNDGKYRMHIFPYEYDEKLPFYYNNNQRFLQKRLDPELIKKSKIFEKAEIKWVCVDDLPKMRKEFRFYFKVVVDDILKQKNEIYNFIKKAMREKTPKNVTRKNRR